MKNETDQILDDLLSRWHAWAKGYNPVRQCSADPMFRNARSAKGYDTTADLVADEVESGQLEAVDFHVSEMQDPHRSAIYCYAKNLYTGASVWGSPRLPQDPIERGIVVMEAKNQLTRRLINAGVM